jgi:hypothetical protein
MTLRQAAFRAVAATVVVPAAAVAAVEDLTARAERHGIAPLIYGQLTIRI